MALFFSVLQCYPPVTSLIILHHMYSLNFMGKATFKGRLKLTHVSGDWVVLCGGGGWNESNESKFHVFRVSCDCYERHPHDLFFFFILLFLNLVTDENSESESDTEEKLQGKNRKEIVTHTGANYEIVISSKN